MFDARLAGWIMSSVSKAAGRGGIGYSDDKKPSYDSDKNKAGWARFHSQCAFNQHKLLPTGLQVCSAHHLSLEICTLIYYHLSPLLLMMLVALLQRQMLALDGTSVCAPGFSVVSTTVNIAPFLVAFSSRWTTPNNWMLARLTSPRCLSRPHLDRLVLTPMEIQGKNWISFLGLKWTLRFDSQSPVLKTFHVSLKKNHSWRSNPSNRNACVHQDTSKWIKMTGMLGEFLIR